MRNQVDQYSDIPQEWIRNYVSSLLNVARTFPAGSDTQASAMTRAEFAMDLLKAFRESEAIRDGANQ